jgi:Thiol:disulfide interchange protein DsbD, N-terminal
MLRGMAKLGAVVLLCSAGLVAQLSPGHRVPSVTMSPAPIAVVRRGGVGSAELTFRVGDGFHVNSNQPTEEYLIPTELKLDAPTDIVIGRVTYPPGQMRSFPFAPKQKLSVYTGEFRLSVVVRPLSSVLPAEYAVHGTLKYQACDNAACYPPKRLPVDFRVKVVKGPRPRRRNPAQSPHVHN